MGGGRAARRSSLQPISPPLTTGGSADHGGAGAATGALAASTRAQHRRTRREPVATPASRMLASDNPFLRRWTQQRRATSRSASRCQEGACMSTATTTAACTRARAARALYTLQQGPRSTKRAPSTAIEFQRARLRVGKTAFTSTTMWRMFAARTGGPRALARSRRRARAAATSRVTGPVLAASSTSEMHCRSQWSRSGLSECNHVAVDGHHLMPVYSTGGWPIQPVRVYVGLK